MSPIADRTRPFDDPLPALSELLPRIILTFDSAMLGDVIRGLWSGPTCVVRTSSHVGLRSRRQPMGEISQFIAMPFDLTEDRLVAGEPFKCTSPASAIERAKGYWQVLGHSGAVAFIRTGYPDAHRAQDIRQRARSFARIETRPAVPRSPGLITGTVCAADRSVSPRIGIYIMFGQLWKPIRRHVRGVFLCRPRLYGVAGNISFHG